MSWQAVELVRDHSRATGATRLCALVLASYANDNEGSGDPYGSIHPSIDTVRIGTGAEPVRNSKGRKEYRGGCSAATVVKARRWLVDNGEAVITGSKMSRTGSRVPILSLTPLLQRSKEPSTDEIDSRAPARATSDSISVSPIPLPSVSGYLGKPFDDPGETLQGSPDETLSLSPGDPSDGKGSPREPFDNAKGSPTEPSGSGLSVSSEGPSKQTPAQQAVERRDDEAELAKLEQQLDRTGFSTATERAIAELRGRLGRDEVAA